jgi:hypothetical protein
MSARLRLALVIAAALGHSGCAVGYVVVRPGADLKRGQRADWRAHRFTVEGDVRDRCAVERVLLERYGVVYVRSGTREEGAFHLAVSRAQDFGVLQGLLLLPTLASHFTAAVLPAYMPWATNVAFTLEGPDGGTFAATGRFEERYISWLPFLILAPTRYEREVDLDRLDAAEALAAEFFRSAEPFVARGLVSSGAVP